METNEWREWRERFVYYVLYTIFITFTTLSVMLAEIITSRMVIISLMILLGAVPIIIETGRYVFIRLHNRCPMCGGYKFVFRKPYYICHNCLWRRNPREVNSPSVIRGRRGYYLVKSDAGFGRDFRQNRRVR